MAQDLANLVAVGADVPLMVLDPDLCVRRFTPAAGALLNLIPSDVGRPFSQIASSLDVADWNDLFAEVTVHGRSIERDVRSHDGRRYSLRMRPLKARGNKTEGVLAVLLNTEITCRSRDNALVSAAVARAESGKSELTFRALLGAIPEAIVGLRPEGKIVLVNAGTERIFGYRANELIGQPVEILVPENVRQSHATYDRIFFAKGGSRPIGAGQVLEGRRKDGTCFPAEVGYFVIETMAGKVGVAMVSDITERRLLEQAAQANNRMGDHRESWQAVLLTISTSFWAGYWPTRRPCAVGTCRWFDP